MDALRLPFSRRRSPRPRPTTPESHPGSPPPPSSSASPGRCQAYSQSLGSFWLSVSSTCASCRLLGAGPLITWPEASYSEPWQGHLGGPGVQVAPGTPRTNLFTTRFQFARQPR